MSRSVEWLRNNGVELSPFGERVAELLGELYLGIYHIHPEVLHKRVNWLADEWIEIVVDSSRFATYDFSLMTELVFLCHHFGIRCEVDGAAHRYLRLTFYNRAPFNEDIHDKKTDWYKTHPTLDQAVAAFRERMSSDKTVTRCFE
jgi:hypothetical protein